MLYVFEKLTFLDHTQRDPCLVRVFIKSEPFRSFISEKAKLVWCSRPGLRLICWSIATNVKPFLHRLITGDEKWIDPPML